MESSTVKTWMIVLQALGALPLVVYPAVLLASVMGLAGHRPATQTLAERICSRLFYAGTILYPIAPVVCYRFAWSAFERGAYAACLWLSAAPLFVLALLAGLFVLMGIMERKRNS